jgi:hypothetical protein
MNFFGGLPTQTRVCFTSSRHSLRYHVITFPFMCGSRGKCLVINSSYHIYILFILNHFFIALCTCFGLQHPIVAYLSQCQCGHTIDNLGTHMFRCPYKSERTTSKNTFRNIIVTIVLESGAHVQREVSHLFPCHT